MWNKVSLGFDAEEETVNFGSRQTAVFQKSVYETNTLAIISRNDEETNAANVEKNTSPKISCTKYFGSDPGIVIFADKSVVILNNDGTEFRSSLSFDARVDCYAVNANGSILFVALSNGDLYCSLLKTSEKPVFLKNICNLHIENQGTFVCMLLHENQGKCDITLIASSGNIYKLTNLNLLEVTKACAAGDKDNITIVVDGTNLEYTSTNKSEYVVCKIIMATEFKKMGDLWILLVTQNRDGQELQLWSDDFKLTYYLPLSNRYSLKKLQVTQNGSLIYGLTSQGTGLIICPYTLTLLHHQENLSIEDFEMLTEDNSLLSLTKNGVSTLQLSSLPDFKIKFQMNINNNCYLTEKQSSLDDLIYLEAVTSKEDGYSDDNIINSIHLKMISESQPEYRLERILRRGKFEEAEQFARTFNLSVESVYKAHLQKLSLDIQPWNTNNIPIEESGSLFKQLLQKVEDTEFVAQCALNAVSSDFDLMKSTLKYAENRIKSCMSLKEANVNTVFQQLYNKIRNTLLRLNTFFAISEKPLIVDNWLSFHKTNLIQECQNLLKQGQLKEIMLIWGRHIQELKSQLTFDQVVSFFRTIPSSMHISRILDWLRMFLPTVFLLFPKIVANLMAWCKEKINIMELLADPGWIETGIRFLKEILTMIRSKKKVVYPNVSQSIIESEFAADSYVKDFLFYIKILTEMSIMKTKYRINISILEYTHENSEEVIFSILDKVPVEEMNSFVKGFFEELLMQNNLNGDVIIMEYIQCLVEGSVNWWYWEEAPWEGRVFILLSCMNSVQEKLNTVLHVLKNSPVPWSVTIMSICDEALKCENPLTRLIYEQKRMVDCKLVLKRYDLKDIKIIQPHFRRIVLYIFQQGRATMLEDALKIANTFEADMCIEVYKLYIQQLIESGDLTSALSLLDDDNLSPKIIISCCESIILRVHCLSGIHVFSKSCDNYIEILDTVNSKLTRAISKISSSSYEPVFSMISLGVCEQLKWVRFLRKNYKEDVTNRCFTNLQKREELLQYCLEKNLKSAKEDQKTLKNINIRLVELANCFSYSTEEIYIRFIRLAMVEEEPNMILLMSKLLLKEELFEQSVSEQIIDLVSLVLSHCIKKPTYVSDYNLAASMYQLTIAALNSCPLGAILKGLEVGKWFYIAQGVTQFDQSVMKSDNEILKSYNQSISSSVLLKLLNAHGVYLGGISLESSVKYSSDENESEVQLHDEINLADVLQSIVEEENESTSFRIITILHWLVLHYCVTSQRDFNDCQMVKQTKELSAVCMNKLLKKFIGSRHLNTFFGSAILHHLDTEEATKWILESTKKYKFDFQRLYALTELGLVYFEQNQCREEWLQIYNLRKRCVWGKQIIEYGLSYKEAFRESVEERRQLLLKLMSLPVVTTDILAKYCKDMDFDFQACLRLYLKQTLLLWEPEFEVKTNTMTGEKEMIVKNTHKKLLNKCREIINLIENRKELYESISRIIWDAVNYYYYEVYLILLTLMEENSTQANTELFSTYRNVFLFLSSYQRISKPKEYEKEQWYLIYQSSQSLPAISEYRLPFRLIFSRWTKSNSDPWKIIRPELNFRTYSKWFIVLEALELDKSILCTFAVNQMTTERTLADTAKSEWCIHLRHQKLLADVQTCIEHISSLEMASASLYFVMNNLPPGADQLAAAKLCFVHAKKWFEEEKSDKSRAGFMKCQKKYLTVSTTHILYFHGLGKPEYLHLVLKPVELINALYNDSRILERHSGNLLNFPDINKAAEEISTLHKENISKIRLELVEEWLLPENFMADTSFEEAINRVDVDNLQEKLSANHDNFLKACYVVERDISSLSPYLVDIVFDRNSEDSKPTSIRIRALQCLCSVISEDCLQQITKHSIAELRNLMITLEFVSELELLGFTYSLSVFNSCNKTEIARSLLSLKTAKAVCLAASICEHFSIRTASIWNGILNKMCSGEMVQELTNILPQLTDIYHTLDLTIFEHAWEIVLLTPLERAPAVLSETELKRIERCVKQIYFCPIIDQIDMQSVKENCIRIGLHSIVNDIDYLNV